MNFLKNFKHIFWVFALVLLIIFGICTIFGRNFLVPLNYFFGYRSGQEATFQDIIYKPKTVAGDDIVVVEIDEKTLNFYNSTSEYSMLTIGKDKYRDLVQILEENGAKAIGFDIIFQNKDAFEKDFIEELEKHKNVTIAVSIPDNQGLCADNSDGSINCPNTPRSTYQNIPWGMVNIGNSENIARVTESRPIGYNMQNYKAQLKAKFGDKTPGEEETKIYSLPIAMMKKEAIPALEKILQQPIENHVIQPYFAGKNENMPYTSISFVDLVERPNIDYSAIFEGKYVLIGESGTHIHDAIISPINNQKIPGVYAHAFFIDSVLQNKIFTKISPILFYSLVAIIALISVAIYFHFSKFISLFIALLLSIVTIFVTRYSYDQWQVIIDIFPLLGASSVISYPITYIYKFFIIERDKRLIMNAFSRYLNPSVVRMIDSSKIEATLGGEKKELSIFFSDIAGFTSIAEKMDTKDLFLVITEYLSTMTDILLSYKGTLDKYIGDAIMGFYGAPIDDDFHAVNACHTAIKMREALGNFNQHLHELGHESIDFRVGIATGEVLVGNIGSKKQFNYTVLGDTVNLASRLEAMGKEYGVNIIIASSTKLAIGDEFIVRELDYIAVKGKNTGVRIYELLGARGDNIDMKKYQIYEQALQLYRSQQYLAAGQMWEKLIEIDPPSGVMARRCVSILKGETSLQNGVYHMTHK